MNNNGIIGIVALLNLIVFASGCQDLVEEHNVVGRYFLVATDTEDQMSLGYQSFNGGYLGIVDETVFAAGVADSFIVVKQHPHNHRDTTHFFIVRIYPDSAENYWPEAGLIGPLSRKEFEVQCAAKGIANPVFTMTIENLQ